jgi:3-methyladenine DNA glycosylase AlkD
MLKALDAVDFLRQGGVELIHKMRVVPIAGIAVADPDDMVVKAMSWALRELVPHDPDAVRAFLTRHLDQLQTGGLPCCQR